jgi:hypothetical protein
MISWSVDNYLKTLRKYGTLHQEGNGIIQEKHDMATRFRHGAWYQGIISHERCGAHYHIYRIDASGSTELTHLRCAAVEAESQFTWGVGGTGVDNLAHLLLEDVLSTCPHTQVCSQLARQILSTLDREAGFVLKGDDLITWYMQRATRRPSAVMA